MSLKKDEWQKDNPFMLDFKTAESAREYIELGGVGAVEVRIERAFSIRLKLLKQKILQLLNMDLQDNCALDLVLNSILVDVRALFLESDWRKRNATLQNVYRARGMQDRALEVDAVFKEEVLPEVTLERVVKDWVDKRVVHVDWLWDDEEILFFERIESLIFGGEMHNLLRVVMRLVDDYENMVSRFGSNLHEQIDLVVANLTGREEADDR